MRIAGVSIGQRVGLLVLVLALSGCGRLRFDPRDDSTAACTFVSVTIGEAFTCALDDAGGVWCWGSNDVGQVTSPPSDMELAAIRVPLAGIAVEVGAGVRFACARLTDGSVWCWGDNDKGQLGTGTTAPTSGPVAVALGADVAAELSVGGRQACIVRASDRAVVCWGGNKSFALGNTGPDPQPVPVLVPGSAGVKDLVLGHRHACGRDAADDVLCWGRGADGQLGVGTSDSATIVRPAGIGTVSAIDATNRVTCVVLAAGGVRCWGSRYLGGSNFDMYPPTVLVPDGISVATSNYAGCAVHADTTVSCWGYLYDQFPAPINNTPTPLPGLTGVTSIEGGWYHYCAFGANGLVCWGDNGQGQLGRGVADMTDTRVAPVSVACSHE